MMVRKTIVKQKVKKTMGRPPTVRGENFVGVRLPTDLLNEIDRWAKDNQATRSNAIRELIERGLGKK